MKNLRCRCGKIVCQTDRDGSEEVTHVDGEDMVAVDNAIYIKCRHCKRMVVIHTLGIVKVDYLESETPEIERVVSLGKSQVPGN